jgi:hypothetical protein
LLDKDDPKKGIKITLNNGDDCKADKSKKYSLTLDMKCNPEVKDKPKIFGVETFNTNDCSPKLTFETMYACPNEDFYKVLKFVKQYSYFIGAILIIFGIFLTFLGNKMMTVTIFLVSTIIVVTLIFVLLFGFIIPGGANPAVVWVVLGISVVAGLVMGYLIAKYRKTFIGFALGGYLGYLLGILLYNSVIVRIGSNLTVNLY